MADFDYSKHYQQVHQISDEYYEIMRKEYRDLLRGLLPSDKTAPILDIGCGTGFALHALRCDGYTNAVGIDADLGQVEIALRRQLRVEHVLADQTSEYLSSLRSHPQVVLLFEVLEHLPYESQLGFLRCIHGALAPGGYLLCQVPNALCVTSTYIRYMDWTHRCLFSTESLSFVLENAGFTVEFVRPAGGRPTPHRPNKLNFIMPIARSLLQGVTNAIWRIFVIANLGVPSGFTHPVTPTIIALARRTK